MERLEWFIMAKLTSLFVVGFYHDMVCFCHDVVCFCRYVIYICYLMWCTNTMSFCGVLWSSWNVPLWYHFLLHFANKIWCAFVFVWGFGVFFALFNIKKVINWIMTKSKPHNDKITLNNDKNTPSYDKSTPNNDNSTSLMTNAHIIIW